MPSLQLHTGSSRACLGLVPFSASNWKRPSLPGPAANRKQPSLPGPSRSSGSPKPPPGSSARCGTGSLALAGGHGRHGRGQLGSPGAGFESILESFQKLNNDDKSWCLILARQKLARLQSAAEAAGEAAAKAGAAALLPAPGSGAKFPAPQTRPKEIFRTPTTKSK